MAIIEIRDMQSSSDREMEIKNLITTLNIGQEALIEIECKIATYRTSFYHFLSKSKTGRNFSIKSTSNLKQWRIIRTQ